MVSRLGKRIIFWTVVLVVLPLGIVSLVVYHEGRKIVREQIYTSLNITAEGIEDKVLNLLEGKKDRVRDFASDGFIKSSLKEINEGAGASAAKALNLHLVKNKAPLDKDIQEIFVFDKFGKAAASTNKGRLKRGEVGYEYFRKGSFGISVGTIESRFAERHFSVSSPVLDRADGGFIGVITVTFKAGAVDDVLKREARRLKGSETVFGDLKNDGRIYVADSGKTVIASKDAELIGRSADTEFLRNTISAGEGMTAEFTGIFGDKRIGASMYIREMDWVVVASVSKERIFAPLDKLSFAALSFVIGGIVVVVLATVVFTKRFTDYLLEVSRAAGRIAEGNWGEEIAVRGGDDEISDLGKSFNSMSAKLKSSVNEIIEGRERLAVLNRFYSVLTRVNEAIIRFREPQELFDATCRICVDEGLFSYVWAGLFEPGTPALRPVAGFGAEKGFLDGLHAFIEKAPEGSGAMGMAIREGRRDVCNDMEKDTRTGPWREEFLRRSCRSAAAFPLKTDKGTVGAFFFYAASPDYFNVENTGLLERMTGDISYALEFSEKEALRRRAEEEVRLLQSVTSSIAEAEDLHSAVEAAIRKICEATNWVYGELWLPSDDGKNLVFGYASYSARETEEIKRFREVSAGFVFPRGVGLPGRVWASKRPEWVRDVSVNGEEYLRTGAAMSAGLRAGLAVPIVEGREVLAVLVFYMSEPGREDERHVAIVSTVASQLGSLMRRKIASDEKAKLEAQVRHMQKMEAIGKLTGGIAHDFNNFLTAIIGDVTLLQMRLARDKESMHLLEQMLLISERAANLTKGLLSFSRREVSDMRPVDLNDIVGSVERLLTRLIGEDIELRVALHEGGIVIRADAGLIEQVLMNLATNARDAIRGEGLITISTEVVNVDNGFIRAHGYGKPGRYALLTFSDSGIGMDAATREKVFEPFFTTKKAGKGTGLGLSIVYGIVKQHEGYINAYSEPGKGTTLRIYIPVVVSPAEVLEAREIRAPRGGVETVLLSEDDSEVRRFVKTVLEEYGYTVIESFDGEDATERFRREKDRIDLLVLDVVMPKRSGSEVYDMAAALKPGVKALFMSGYNEDVIQRNGILEKGLDFISKPFIPTEFIRKVRAVLDR